MGSGYFIILSINDDGAPSSISTPRSAVQLLMASSRKLHLPKEMGSNSVRGDIWLYNDIIHFMSNNSLGFHAGVE